MTCLFGSKLIQGMDLNNLLCEIHKLSVQAGEYVTFKFPHTDKELKVNYFLFKKFHNICDVLSLPHKGIIEIDIPESISYQTCCLINNNDLPHDIDSYLDLIFACNFLGHDELLKSLYPGIVGLLTFEETIKLRILHFGPYIEEEYMKLAYYYKHHNLDENFNLLTQVYNNPWENPIDKKFHKLEADNVKNILLLNLNPCKVIKYHLTNDINERNHYLCDNMRIPISFMERKLNIKTEFDSLNNKFREITKVCCYRTLPNIYILYHNMTCLYHYAHHHNLYYASLYNKDFTDYKRTKRIYSDSIEEVEELKLYFEPLYGISYYLKRIDIPNIRPLYHLSSGCPSFKSFLKDNPNTIHIKPNNILAIKMNSFFLNRKTDAEIRELSYAKSIHYISYNREKLIDCLARIINPVTF